MGRRDGAAVFGGTCQLACGPACQLSTSNNCLHSQEEAKAVFLQN